MSDKNSTPQKILIIRTDRIGDVVLSTPVIKALREAYPESHIAMMSRPYAKEIIEGNPFLNEVIIYDKYGKHKSFLSTIKFALSLRKKDFDTALILHPTNRAHLISWLAAIPQRVGYNKKLGFLLTRTIEDKKHLGLMHEIDYNFELLKELGVEAKDRMPFMPVREDALRWVDNLFIKHNINRHKPVFCVHPGASCISKRWPAENFAKLIDVLKEELGAQIIVFVGKQDAEIARRVNELSKNKPLCVLENVSLSYVAALLKKSDLLISNDSGPVHISVAVNTPVVSIFGRKQPGLSPKRWGPVGHKDIILHRDAGCAVCLAHNCQEGFKCLKAITIEDVVEAVRRISKK